MCGLSAGLCNPSIFSPSVRARPGGEWLRAFQSPIQPRYLHKFFELKATDRVSFLLAGERFHGRLNRSSVLSDVPAEATRVDRTGPGYKVIRLGGLSHRTRQYFHVGTDEGQSFPLCLQGGDAHAEFPNFLKNVVAYRPRRGRLARRQELIRGSIDDFFEDKNSRDLTFDLTSAVANAREGLATDPAVDLAATFQLILASRAGVTTNYRTT
jgi:hypothetical protein